MRSVAAFTDTYLPTVNGVTYTVQAWRDCWTDRGGRMDVVYPRTDGYAARAGEYPVRSLPFPFYPGFRLGVPVIPRRVRDVDVVHAHTPFAIGIAGLRLARRRDRPLVASYHTPTAEYADYVAPGEAVEALVERASKGYERWFFDRADAVVAPSEATATHLTDEVGVSTPVTVVPNGIDTERFRPVDPGDFLARHGLDDAGTLLGYTGRHGYEKRLRDAVDAAAALDVTLVFGGDGPAREDLETRAAERGVDARFLGFLDREELPAFYSALDAFVFPSPIETQGLVALEANACGTPVVGANDGALADTVVEGETGYHFETGDVDGLRASIRRTLAERDELGVRCLARRDRHGVDRAVDRLADVYDRVS
ncbi:glycosyltransferase [Haloplanus halophilus]|uniref:glycosyltransferase n=1 Tax=Haloplanus halophilus TaxID=2949993 RepID=UPI0020402DCF|nr:glycosyltransferase [Haloplanus sp. GDY1]